MRKLVVISQMTLDGVMQAPGGADEDTSGGFELGGWSFGYFDDTLMGKIMESLAKPFDLVLGRRTYEIFAGYWPHQEGPIADALNGARKYVASRTLESVDWANAKLLEGDAADALARLKEAEGPELQVQGSTNLLQSLLRAGLVDEFRIAQFPVVAGSGKRLFEGGAAPAGLRLIESSVSPNGVALLTYEKEGEVKRGEAPA